MGASSNGRTEARRASSMSSILIVLDPQHKSIDEKQLWRNW